MFVGSISGRVYRYKLSLNEGGEDHEMSESMPDDSEGSALPITASLPDMITAFTLAVNDVTCSADGSLL